MVITKTNPVGIDKEIQLMQNALYNYLKIKWSLTDSDYNCYGRAYKNKKENGYVAEVFTGEKDYKEVFFNDGLKALSFFTVSDKVDNNLWKGMTTIGLVFFANIQKLKPTIAHRADEEVRLDVLSFFDGSRDTGTGFAEVQNIEMGIGNVLREYYRGNLEGKVDMHPNHLFRINLSIQQKFITV